MSVAYLPRHAREHVVEAVDNYRDRHGSMEAMREIRRRLRSHGIDQPEIDRYSRLLESTYDIW